MRGARTTDRDHGTYARYVFGPRGSDTANGCRCEGCRRACRDYERERSRRVAPAYVGADRSRSHVRELMAAGVGLKTIAKRSGVSHGGLSKLMYGTQGRPPSKRVRKSTEDALLAISANDRADGAYVDATPTRRTIAKLVKDGWTKTAIAEAIGVDVRNLDPRGPSTTVRKAHAIAALVGQPIPPRRTRWGTVDVNTDAQRRKLEAERRAQYRAAPKPEVTLPTIDPDLFDAPWRSRSACRLLAPEDRWIFWPGRGDWRTVKAAKEVCQTCPVAGDCLAYALDAHELGVWGGTTEIQRRRMRAAA